MMGSFKVHGSRFAVHRFKETVNCKQLTVNLRSGFSLIELMVVIVLFGVASSLITISYLTFEHNQRIKNAAATLKTDIRFAQNKALSGDKGQGGTCASTSSLVGWYVTVKSSAGNNDNYTIFGDCITGGTEVSFNPKNVKLPQGITISNIIHTAGCNPATANILFRPLSNAASFHGASAPPFLDASGNLTNLTGCDQSKDLEITLSESGISTQYKVIVKSTGEANETKI